MFLIIIFLLITFKKVSPHLITEKVFSQQVFNNIIDEYMPLNTYSNAYSYANAYAYSNNFNSYNSAYSNWNAFSTAFNSNINSNINSNYISYSFYKVYAGLYEVDYKTVPLNEQFQIAVEDYQQPNGGIIFPNPNAPTGCLLPLAAIEQLLQANPHRVVIVDEAYIDFGGQTAIGLINQYPQLLVVQTLSKSRSLAGLRVGLAVGQAHLIEALERVKNSFNSYPMDKVAIAGGVAAFEDKAYFQQTCQAIIDSRTWLTIQLAQLGFDILPSAANFVFARHPQRDAGQLALALRERAIIVRHFKQPRIEQFLRITIGKREDNEALVNVLKEILA